MDILFKPGEILMVHKNLSDLRRIFMYRHTHPQGDYLNESFEGDSIGHWEGKTLVIDTVGLRNDTFIEIGMPNDKNMHIIERWTQTGPDELTVQETLIDPKLFTKPWGGTWHWKRTDAWIEEVTCVAKRNRWAIINGKSVMLGADGKPLLGPAKK
jgi:hypothetical protein